jgi:uncharacterized protein (DUF58 family)
MGRGQRRLRTRLGLTSRGWTFLLAGLGLVVAGILLRLSPAVQFGALVAALPVVAALLTHGPGRNLGLERVLSAHEVTSGERVRVTVEVRGRIQRGQSLLLEDLAPAELGGPHRFAITGTGGTGVTRPHYLLHAGARGLHHIGPMRLHVVDRFGLVHKVVSGEHRSELLVIPRVVPLEPHVLGGAAMGAGAGTLGARGAAADDVIPREYHPGDEVRRIDWKASARTGDLMVRSEENPWRAAVTIVLDLHADDHAGLEPDSSLDTVLSLAASIGVMALDAGWDLSVRTTDDVAVFVGSPVTGAEVERRGLLRALATVPVSTLTVPSVALRHSMEVAGTGPLVVIAGTMGMASAKVLAGIGAHTPRRMLLHVASEQWQPVAAGRVGWATGGPGHRVQAPGGDPLAPFRASGWQVARVERDTGAANAWAQLGGAA